MIQTKLLDKTYFYFKDDVYRYMREYVENNPGILIGKLIDVTQKNFRFASKNDLINFNEEMIKEGYWIKKHEGYCYPRINFNPIRKRIIESNKFCKFSTIDLEIFLAIDRNSKSIDDIIKYVSRRFLDFNERYIKHRIRILLKDGYLVDRASDDGSEYLGLNWEKIEGKSK